MSTNDMIKGLSHDFSKGTDEFRENLLAQCLAEISTARKSSGWTLVPEVRELDDNDLEFLAAAGDLTALQDGQE